MFRRAKSSESVLFSTDQDPLEIKAEIKASFAGDATVLEVALDNDIDISTSCEGMGTCGTCRVFVLPGGPQPGPRNEVESEFAEERGFAPDERLACQIQAINGLRLRLPKKRL